MKVYVITSGEYSDYRICAVTLDPEKAERLKEIYDAADYTGASIEEYETDVHNDRILAGYRLYEVEFKTNGDVVYVGDNTFWCTHEDILKNSVNNVIAIKVYAKNEKAAIKIAAERRAKFLAEEEGIA